MKIGFIVDDLNSFNIAKDSTYMMLKAVSDKNWQIFTFYMNDLYIINGNPRGNAQNIEINENSDDWFTVLEKTDISLNDLDAIFMRKDPPFNMEYIYVTYMLDLAQKNGVLIVNNPQILRDYNEKVAISNFPQFAPNTLISRNYKEINEFYNKYKDIIVKPLDGMGGSSIFRIKENDKNKNVILEVLTNHQSQFIMVQDFQKGISQGDKRILIVDGVPISYCMARIPGETDNRGNLAAGATAEIRKLTARDSEIANAVAKDLKEKGVLFAGLDIIGDTLTEVNITSPTGVQEIYKKTNINAAELLMEAVELKLQK